MRESVYLLDGAAAEGGVARELLDGQGLARQRSLVTLHARQTHSLRMGWATLR